MRDGTYITDDYEESRKMAFITSLVDQGHTVLNDRRKCQKPDMPLMAFVKLVQALAAKVNSSTAQVIMYGPGYSDNANTGTATVFSKDIYINVQFEPDIATIDVFCWGNYIPIIGKAIEEITMPLGPRIHWAYGKHGETMTQQLNMVPLVIGAYPWMKQTYEDYVDAFMKSSANILILLGPAGTGKTSFIRNMIARTKSQALLTYDQELIRDERFFVNFMEGQSTFMVAEDCDTMLKSREDGNTMMHRFLNIADGLVSSSKKKLIFSTNLPTVRDIDTALIRPGRCFDVMEFRPLTRVEATAVTTRYNLDLADGNSFTLAELFNGEQPSATTVNRSMGFT
jgi:hypothetical protein